MAILDPELSTLLVKAAYQQEHPDPYLFFGIDRGNSSRNLRRRVKEIAR